MSSSRDDFGIAIRSALLQRGAKQKFSLVFLISLALLIFFLDYYSFKLTKVTRTIVNDVIYRVSNLATKPFHFANDIFEKTEFCCYIMETIFLALPLFFFC